MLFLELGEEKDSRFIYSNKVEEFLKDDTQVFAMFSSLKVETEAVNIDMPVVCEFSYVFSI